MRRGLASIIIGVSLLLATLSWAGFTLSRTVLDPGRSERLAEQLLENPDVRAALVSRLADALEAEIPPEIPVPRQVIDSGAELALDDPRVEALIIDGFVQVHRNALAGIDEPVIVDAGALGAAGREAVVDARPELAPLLPPAPPLTMELPTTGLSWMGRLQAFVDRYTTIGALLAVFGATVAFAVARNRGSVLRRVAFWGYGAAAFWLAVGYGIPWLAQMLSPTSAAIAAAAVDVFFGAMIRPAVTLAVISTVLLLVGFAWPALTRGRGARVLQPKRKAIPSLGPSSSPSSMTSSGPSAPAARSHRATPLGGTPLRNVENTRPLENTEEMPVRSVASVYQGDGDPAVTQVMPAVGQSPTDRFRT